MKIASWNVNSLKVRLPHVLQWLEQADPDVLTLQETKLTDENFPVAEINAAGYEVIFSGQKTYNGVAILSKTTASEVVCDIAGLDDPQRRILAATVADVRILNLYVVNGQEVGSEKYAYKLKWLDAVKNYIEVQLAEHAKCVVLGDFNICPQDEDVHDPASWEGKILCSDLERANLSAIFDMGLKDTFRLFEQAENSFSWWDYRAAAFRRNMGMRIDLVLANEALSSVCQSAGIDKEPRTWERPSDHTPVWAVFDI